MVLRIRPDPAEFSGKYRLINEARLRALRLAKEAADKEAAEKAAAEKAAAKNKIP